MFKLNYLNFQSLESENRCRELAMSNLQMQKNWGNFLQKTVVCRHSMRSGHYVSYIRRFSIVFWFWMNFLFFNKVYFSRTPWRSMHLNMAVFDSILTHAIKINWLNIQILREVGKKFIGQENWSWLFDPLKKVVDPLRWGRKIGLSHHFSYHWITRSKKKHLAFRLKRWFHRFPSVSMATDWYLNNMLTWISDHAHIFTIIKHFVFCDSRIKETKNIEEILKSTMPMYDNFSHFSLMLSLYLSEFLLKFWLLTDGRKLTWIKTALTSKKGGKAWKKGQYQRSNINFQIVWQSVLFNDDKFYEILCTA